MKTLRITILIITCISVSLLNACVSQQTISLNQEPNEDPTISPITPSGRVPPTQSSTISQTKTIFTPTSVNTTQTSTMTKPYHTATVDPYTAHPLPTITPSSTPTYFFQEGVNPLTGLAVTNPDILNRRPIFIKISNYPPYSRPQAGLSAADLVFEYYIGEGLNRFMAVYYGNDAPMAGPIRSGRLVDAQIVEMYQGFLIYGGADDRVDSVIENILGDRAIDVTEDHPCPPICGVDTHSQEGVFTASAAITEYIEKLGIDNSKPTLNWIAFNENPPAGLAKATQIGIQFSKICRGEWRYDKINQSYQRWIEQDLNINIMVPLVDKNTGETLSFHNVVILFADYIIYTPTLYDIGIWNNKAGKRAILFRDGYVQEGVWKAYDDRHPIQLFDTMDNPLYLKPGNTWIVLASTQTTFESVTEGNWEMKFSLP